MLKKFPVVPNMVVPQGNTDLSELQGALFPLKDASLSFQIRTCCLSNPIIPLSHLLSPYLLFFDKQNTGSSRNHFLKGGFIFQWREFIFRWECPLVGHLLWWGVSKKLMEWPQGPPTKGNLEREAEMFPFAWKQ